ncbi:MAG: DUF4097 family beta strand repeat protein [Sedimentisphaerales bacterium]|nr:DUF4097 family beta strand repeat protein [Sedimentisphaerales bacterium]
MKCNHASDIALGLALATISLVLGCYIDAGHGGCSSGSYPAKAQRTEELTVPLGEVSALDVETNVGTIVLDSAEVAEAHITADITVRAKTDEEAQQLVEQVRISAAPSGRDLVIKAVKPPGFGRNQLAVDFTITAPGRLAVTGTTNVGDIRVTRFAGNVEARTDVGKIVCNGLRRDATLRTNVGDIRAAYAPDAPARIELAATTNVGDIDFTGPSEVSARLSASSNVGSIDTDRPLTVTGQMKKSINATLGNAEGDIRLRTNVGSIKIR